MSPLTQAISQGFSSEQIVEYLLRHFPKYSKQIQKALGQGFSANQVVKYLNNGRKGLNEIDGELTEHEKTRKSDYDKEKRLEKNIGKGALALGATALGAYGLSRSGQSIIPEVLPAIQGNFSPKQDVEIDLTPRIAQQTKQIEQQPPNQLIQQSRSPEAPQPPNIPQQPIIHENPQINFGQILEQLGIKDKIDNLKESNSPEVISRFIVSQLPREQLKSIKDNQIPLDQIIDEYVKNSPPAEKLEEKIAKGVPFGMREQEQKEVVEPIQDIAPIQEDIIPRKEKGSFVSLPDGKIGEIEDIRQGIAKVNVNGKIRSKKLDELEEEPENVIQAVQDILKIPEASRSSVFALSHYSEPRKQMTIQFHNGNIVEYDEVPEEVFESVSQGKHTPKSKGGDTYGVFSPEDIEKSRGSTFFREIKSNPKYSKANEGITWRYVRKGYDYWQPLRKEKKQKKASDS